jgi:hypothetical protein
MQTGFPQGVPIQRHLLHLQVHKYQYKIISHMLKLSPDLRCGQSAAVLPGTELHQIETSIILPIFERR